MCDIDQDIPDAMHLMSINEPFDDDELIGLHDSSEFVHMEDFVNDINNISDEDLEAMAKEWGLF